MNCPRTIHCHVSSPNGHVATSGILARPGISGEFPLPRCEDRPAEGGGTDREVGLPFRGTVPDMYPLKPSVVPGRSLRRDEGGYGVVAAVQNVLKGS